MDHQTLLATTFAFASFALVWWQTKSLIAHARRNLARTHRAQPVPTLGITALAFADTVDRTSAIRIKRQHSG